MEAKIVCALLFSLLVTSVSHAMKNIQKVPQVAISTSKCIKCVKKGGTNKTKGHSYPDGVIVGSGEKLPQKALLRRCLSGNFNKDDMTIEEQSIESFRKELEESLKNYKTENDKIFFLYMKAKKAGEDTSDALSALKNILR